MISFNKLTYDSFKLSKNNLNKLKGIQTSLKKSNPNTSNANMERKIEIQIFNPVKELIRFPTINAKIISITIRIIRELFFDFIDCFFIIIPP